MNPTTSQPEGSPRNEDYADLIAANFPGNPAINHWACGMPLSYVQEMADRCLSCHDKARQLDHSFDPSAGQGDESELRET